MTYNGDTQTLSDNIDPSSKIATINFIFGVASVPEFGMLTGLVAAAGSGLAYLGIRRRMSV